MSFRDEEIRDFKEKATERRGEIVMGRPVARGVLIREEHIETLKRLPNKTMDAVLGAAFRVSIGGIGALSVKDPTGILDAVVQSIAVAALKFDEKEKERRAGDAERQRRYRNSKGKNENPRDNSGQERDGSVTEERQKRDKNVTKADKRGVGMKEGRKERKNI